MSFTDGEVINTELRLRRLAGSIPSGYSVFAIDGTYYAETSIPGGTSYEKDTLIEAVQAALDVQQGKVTLKAGTYPDTSSSSLTVYEGSCLEGEGTKTVWEVDYDKTLIVADDPTGGTWNTIVGDLKFIQKNTRQGTAINMRGLHNTSIDNVYIEKFTTGITAPTPVFYGTIDTPRIIDCTTCFSTTSNCNTILGGRMDPAPNGKGADVNGNNLTVVGTSFECAVKDGQTGVYFDSDGDHGQLIGPWIENLATGIYVHATCHFVSIMNPVLNNNTTDIDDNAPDTLKLIGHKLERMELPRTTFKVVTFGNDDVTPSVKNGNIFKTATGNGGALDVTTFDDGEIGQEIKIIASDPTNKTTVKDGSNLLINSDWLEAAEKTLSLVYDGTNWYELNRR